MITFFQFIEQQDKMSLINIQQSLQGKPQAWIQAVSRLPELLQKEIIDERPNPIPEDIQEISAWKVENQPIQISLTDLLKNKDNLDSITRCPADVVQEINQKWGLQVKPGKIWDQTSRHREYAKFQRTTAKPSVMVNGEIVFGVGRFIAALLRGDQQMTVWNIRK